MGFTSHRMTAWAWIAAFGCLSFGCGSSGSGGNAPTGFDPAGFDPAQPSARSERSESPAGPPEPSAPPRSSAALECRFRTEGYPEIGLHFEVTSTSNEPITLSWMHPFLDIELSATRMDGTNVEIEEAALDIGVRPQSGEVSRGHPLSVGTPLRLVFSTQRPSDGFVRHLRTELTTLRLQATLTLGEHRIGPCFAEVVPPE